MYDARTIRWQRVTLVTLFVGYAGYYLCRSNLSVITPLLLQDTSGTGLRKEDVGVIASAGVLLYALGKVTNGLLADFLGGKVLFLGGMAASVVCTALFGIGQGVLLFLVVWGVNRYVQSMGWGALVKIAARWYPVSVQASVMGVLAMSYLLGDAAARWYLGSFLRLGMDWRGVMLVSAATLGVILVASLPVLKGSPREVGADEPPAHPDNVFGGEAPRPESLGRLLTPLLRSPAFWLACWMSAGLTLIRETFNLWTPTYLTEVAGLDPGRAAQYSMFFPLVGAGSALLAGLLTDRMQGRYGRVALPALVGLTAALALLCLVPIEGMAGRALPLIGGVSFFLMAPYSFCSGIIPLHLGGKRGSSTAAGLIDGAGYLGAVVSGYGMGTLAQNHGWPVAFASLAGVAGLTTAAAVLYSALQRFAPGNRGGPPAAVPSRESPSPPPEPVMSAADLPGHILQLFKERGNAAYIGEPVSQTEHALQAAWAAERAGAGSALIAAALLHDVGHLLHDLPEDCAEHGIDDAHEERGARWLLQHFGPEVTEPVRLHVPAKRYLCAAEPGYLGGLSEASLRSLKLQGGPFTPEEAAAFRRNPHAEAAVALRRWDEQAKVRGLATPDLEHFRPHLEAALGSRHT